MFEQDTNDGRLHVYFMIFFYHFRMQKKMMKTGEKILVKMLLDKEWRN